MGKMQVAKVSVLKSRIAKRDTMLPKMDVDTNEVVRVDAALAELENRIATLLQDGNRLEFSWEQEEDVKKRTTELKNEIKRLNKNGTIDGGKTPRSDVERMFFSKGIQAASSSFLLRADVSPRNPKWSSGLTTVRGELSYFLATLRKRYPTT